MKKLIKFFRLSLILMFVSYFSGNVYAQERFEYKVAKLNGPIVIDANWNKSQWEGVDSIEIDNILGALPKFKPITYVKMLYDDQNIYVIFIVQDRFVRCVTNEINGPVWEDACVEFFFSPDMTAPEKYFNLEVTGGGTPLLCYNTYPRELIYLDTTDIKEIEIAHSLPELILNEIADSVTWTVEYKVPLTLLEKYAKISRPVPGVIWMVNFYKTASSTSNPHYFSWAKIINPVPDFHLPQFFGELKFENLTSVESANASRIELYPNPATDFISVKGLNKAATVTIFNLLGCVAAIYTNMTERIAISELKEGIYFVNIVDGENNITKKLIKK